MIQKQIDEMTELHHKMYDRLVAHKELTNEANDKYIVKVNIVYTIGIDKNRKTFLNGGLPHLLSLSDAKQAAKAKFKDKDGNPIKPVIKNAVDFLDEEINMIKESMEVVEQHIEKLKEGDTQ